MAKRTKYLFKFEQPLTTTAAFDESGMRIPQVSLIEMGEAKGHECFVDRTTISQVFQCAQSLGTLKFKIDHGAGVLSTEGWMDNFTMSATNVYADLNFYDTMDEKDRKKILEIAKKNPTHLGISLEFEGEDETLANKNFARCEELFTAALVSDPAANKSFFEKKKLAPPADYCMSDPNKKLEQKNMATEGTIDPNTKTEVKTSNADDQQPPAWAQAMCKKFDDNMAGQAALMARMDKFEGVPAKKPEDQPATPAADKTLEEGKEDKELEARMEKYLSARGVDMKSLGAKLGIRGTGVTPGVGTHTGAVKPGAGANGDVKEFEVLVAEKSAELLADGEAKDEADAKVKATLICMQSNKKAYHTFHRKMYTPAQRAA